MVLIELSGSAFLFIFIDLMCDKGHRLIRIPASSVCVCLHDSFTKLSVACDSHEVVQAVGFRRMFFEMRPVDVDDLKMVLSVFLIKEKIREVCVSVEESLVVDENKIVDEAVEKLIVVVESVEVRLHIGMSGEC